MRLRDMDLKLFLELENKNGCVKMVCEVIYNKKFIF